MHFYLTNILFIFLVKPLIDIYLIIFYININPRIHINYLRTF